MFQANFWNDTTIETNVAVLKKENLPELEPLHLLETNIIKDGYKTRKKILYFKLPNICISVYQMQMFI